MFIDFVRIHVKAGDGGNGCCSFRREKYVPRGGPDGGQGGKGGDIVFEADSHLGTLLDLKMQPTINGGRGGHGSGANKTGRDGEGVLVKLPLGSVIYEEGNETPIADLTVAGERVVVAKGGDGGFGNLHYASSKNRSPRRCDPGWPGEEKVLLIELKQIADVGFVGLPNAGKSTLLKTLTAAEPKIAPYPFTTLHPNLGVMEDEYGRHVTLADLPGLIEGASRGEGLGHRFLRHVERTKILAHLVPFGEPDRPATFEDMRYQWDLIEAELRAYSDVLAQKPRLLVLSKCDLVDTETRDRIVAQFSGEGFEPLVISSASGEGIDHFKRTLLDLLVTPLAEPVQQHEEDSSTGANPSSVEDGPV